MLAPKIHVIPAGRSGWVVELEGEDGATSYHSGEQGAIAAGIEKAKQAHAELYIHGRDGQIRERQSFALAFADGRIISE